MKRQPSKTRKYNLSFGHLGNGVTVWTADVEEHGDYKRIAHISQDGTEIKWYIDQVHPSNRSLVEIHAKQQSLDNEYCIGASVVGREESLKRLTKEQRHRYDTLSALFAHSRKEFEETKEPGELNQFIS